jgi:hypothetical protein
MSVDAKTIIPDYLWTVDTNHTNNNEALYTLCLQAESILQKRIPCPQDLSFFGSYMTSIFKEYNILTFTDKHFFKLYYCLLDNIEPFLDKDKSYVIQAWANIFRSGEFIDWHGHWEKRDSVIHGYYCVNADNTTTSYRFTNNENVVYNVDNKNGLLVFGRSAGDEHCSSPWTQEGQRITIAFDIVPIDSLLNTTYNHYIPFRR